MPIVTISKMIKKLLSLVWRITSYPWYKFQYKSIYLSTRLSPTKNPVTPKYIECGKNVAIGPYARIEGVNRYENSIFFPRIILEDNVTIQQNIHLTCANLIQVGKNTAIAANVTLTDIDHPYLDINIPIEKQALVVKPVIIGPDCKIYNGAVILQGTTIGKHCVVGANSVVRGTFPDYCVIVGAPARIVKRYNLDTQCWERTDPDGRFLKTTN